MTTTALLDAAIRAAIDRATDCGSADSPIVYPSILVAVLADHGYAINPTAPSQDVAERAAAALIEGLHPGGSFILSATDGAAKYDADRFRDIAAAVLATARASEPADGWRPITDADRQIGPSFFGGKWHYTANGWEWHEHNAFWSAGMQSFCDTWSGKKIDLDWRRPLPPPAPMPEAAPAPAPEREG